MHKTAKSSTSQRSNSSLQLGKKERCHVGVDVHKRTYHVAVWSEERGLIATWVQPANAGLLVEKLGSSVEFVGHEWLFVVGWSGSAAGDPSGARLPAPLPQLLGHKGAEKRPVAARPTLAPL